MDLPLLLRKIRSAWAYGLKEVRVVISKKSPFMVAVPRMIYFEFGDIVCDGKCRICAKGLARLNGKVMPAGGIPPGILERILREVHELCGRGVVLSFTCGGEPTLYDGLLDALRLASRLGVDFSFTTNGYRLTDAYVRDLVAADPFAVGVSLEAIDPDANEKIRALPGGTAKTIQGIEYLISEKHRQRSRVKINIKSVVTAHNLTEVPRIIKRFGRESGVMFTPQPYHYWNVFPVDIAKEMWVTDLKALRVFIDELKSLKRDGYIINADDGNIEKFMGHFESGLSGGVFDPDTLAKTDSGHLENSSMEDRLCEVGLTTLMISHSGDVKMCTTMAPIGNISEGTSLKQIWYGKKADELRRIISKCRKPCTLSCMRTTTLRDRITAFLKT